MTIPNALRRLWPWHKPSPPLLAPVEAYRQWAATYGDDPNALQRLEAETLDRILPTLTDKRVLDLGCGKARVAAQVLEAGARSALAADATLAMLVSEGRARHEALCRVAATTHPLPFRDAAFELVVCALVLGHVADLAGALESMARVVAPGGDLVITDFHPDATRRGWQRTFRDTRGVTARIEQHRHDLDTYRTRLAALDLRIEVLEEATWNGTPVIFALRAHKVQQVPEHDAP